MSLTEPSLLSSGTYCPNAKQRLGGPPSPTNGRPRDAKYLERERLGHISILSEGAVAQSVGTSKDTTGPAIFLLWATLEEAGVSGCSLQNDLFLKHQ